MKMPWRLYKANFSPPSRAVMMILDILKVPHETVEVSFKRRDHLTPIFLKKNPVHQIPVLEGSDFVLHDSHAILTYLADRYGKDDTLYPKDLQKRALVNQKLFFNTCFPYTRLRVIAKGALYYGQESITEKQRDDIYESYSFFEEFLSRSKFLAGDHVTIADISAITYITTTTHLIPLDSEKYPLTDAWIKYMEKQSYVQKHNAAGALELAETIKKFLDRNHRRVNPIPFKAGFFKHLTA